MKVNRTFDCVEWYIDVVINVFENMLLYAIKLVTIYFCSTTKQTSSKKINR